MTNHPCNLPLRKAARRSNTSSLLQVSGFRPHPFSLLPISAFCFLLSALSAFSSLFSISAFCFLLSALPLNAQSQGSPVTAEITVSKAELFEKETFQLTLTIKTVGVQIRQKLDLAGLPDKRQVDLFTEFETLPTQRVGDGHRITEIHRYRCRARSLAVGTVRIAPTLRLTAVRRRRLFIGSAWEEFPLQVPITPVLLTVKALPPPPSDFSGAIGTLGIRASIDPADVAPGDLVTLTTRVTGEGYLGGLRVPQIDGRPHFKVYDASEVHADKNLRVYEQIVIPQSTNATAIPAVSLTYFDTTKGTYTRATRGPFPITFHAAPAATLEHFRPTDTDTLPSPVDTPAQPTVATRVRDAFGRARYEQGICVTGTEARLAPSPGSLATFELPADSQIDILHRLEDWVMVESDRRRGWIPLSALEQ